MKTNDSSASDAYTLTADPRHLRLLFYVPNDCSIAILRRLMIKNLRLWGGRFNPIVPLDDGKVRAGWEQVIRHKDPDYVYYLPGTDRDLISSLCDQFRHNPIEIIELDERLLDIHGVHYANLMLLPPAMTLPRVYNLSGIGTPLADFYALNFFVDDTLPVNQGVWTQDNDWLFRHHNLTLINKGNFSQVNSIWATSNLTSITRLSELNSKVSKLRMAKPGFHGFELVVSADNCGFEELIYHWNKVLYDVYSPHPLTIVLTRSELCQLMNDKSFKRVLFKHSYQNLKISMVSFSLTEEEQQQLADQLKAYDELNSFEPKKVTDFPFAVMDSNSLSQQPVYERPHQQVIFRNQPFIMVPPLSFDLEFKPFSPRYGFRLQIAEVRGPFNQILRFPTKTLANMIVHQPARIDCSRQIFAEVNETLHVGRNYSLHITDFYAIISQVVGSPRITGSREIRNIYQGIAYSDSSRRLAQFIQLFDDDFLIIQSYLLDDFWHSLFLELSDNNKTEGDTITFEKLFERCHALMIKRGVQFTTKDKGRFNVENLQLGLKSQLQQLTDRKIFLPGFIVKCGHCGSRVWYGLEETKTVIICKGCSNSNQFPVETPVAYKLNHLVKNNYGMKDDKGVFRPDGNLTAIRTLLYLWNRAVNSFQYIPQIDIYDCTDAHKPMTDLDIVTMSGGDFIIGECKNDSALFFEDKNKSLENLLTIGRTTMPDKIILSCIIDRSDKLKKAAEFIKHNTRNWLHTPQVIAFHAKDPDDFESRDSKYFYY